MDDSSEDGEPTESGDACRIQVAARRKKRNLDRSIDVYTLDATELRLKRKAKTNGETTPDRTARLAADATKRHDKADTELAIDRTARLAAATTKRHDKAANESAEDRDARLAADTTKRRDKADTELAIDRTARLAAATTKRHVKAANESAEDRDARLAADTTKRRDKAANESAEDKNRRLAAAATKRREKVSTSQADTRPSDSHEQNLPTAQRQFWTNAGYDPAPATESEDDLLKRLDSMVLDEPAKERIVDKYNEIAGGKHTRVYNPRLATRIIIRPDTHPK
jgi:hypothetical protein